MCKFLIFFIAIVNLLQANSWLDRYHEKILEWQVPQWMVAQIEEDFAPFEPRGFTEQDITRSAENYAGWYGFTRYHFSDGNLIPATNYDKVGIFLDYLRSAHKEWGLPDFDFVVTQSDGIKWFQDSDVRGRAPIFTWGKDNSLKGFILVNDISTTLDGYNVPPSIPWDERIEKIVWRGSAVDAINIGGVDRYTPNNWTDFPRGLIVNFSLTHPEYIDARFTGYYCYCPRPVIDFFYSVGAMGDFITQSEQLKYKYQTIIDGNVCSAPGFQWRLFSGNPIFKPVSNQIQWFYKGLVPWVHYIPVKTDLSDFIEKIEWAKSHDCEVRQIGENAKIFAETYINHETMKKYVYLVMLRYLSLLK